MIVYKYTLLFHFVYFQFYLVMKGQGLANDTTERSKNGPGKFVASKVKASSQAAVTAAVGPGQSSATQQPASNNVPISSIGLSENSKLSEKDIQVCVIETLFTFPVLSEVTLNTANDSFVKLLFSLNWTEFSRPFNF